MHNIHCESDTFRGTNVPVCVPLYLFCSFLRGFVPFADLSLFNVVIDRSLFGGTYLCSEHVYGIGHVA